MKDDPALASSDEDSEVDYNNDAEEVEKEYTHVFTANFVLRYPDESDDLILHWGLSRKATGAWGTPDKNFLPENTQNWGDGLACQSYFKKEAENPSIRTLQIVIKWRHEVEPPVTSISFVINEKKKNQWTSLDGRDKVIVFCPNDEPQHGNGEFPGAPKGKIGYAVNDILNCEVNYDMWTLKHRYHKCKDIFCSGNVDISNRDNVAYIYIWLRYSFMK